METRFLGESTVEVVDGSYFMKVVGKPRGGIEVVSSWSYTGRIHRMPRSLWRQMLSAAGRELRRHRASHPAH